MFLRRSPWTRVGPIKRPSNQIIKDRNTSVLIRQVKYLNNLIEQDHRAVKRVTKPMLNFKSFRAAKRVLAGIELMRKGQMTMPSCAGMSFADQFFALA